MDYAQEIKERVSMIEVAERYGFEVNHSGFMPCCFHNERTASMKIYSGNRGFYCFGCNEHGSVIDFVMKYFNLSFHQAIDKINCDFSLGFPIGERITLRQKRDMERKERERQAQRLEYDKLKLDYDHALGEYTRLEKQKREYSPKSPDEDLHPLFIEAIQKISYFSLKLDDAEMRLSKYGNE